MLLDDLGINMKTFVTFHQGVTVMKLQILKN